MTDPIVGPGADRHVLLTLDDDSVAIMTPAPELRVASFPDGTRVRYRFVAFPDAGWIEREIAKWMPTTEERSIGRTGWLGGRAVLGHRVIYRHEIPADRFYRNAWCERGGAIVHDMERARAIHREKIRAVVESMMPAFTLEYVRADYTRNATRKLAVGRQIERLHGYVDDPAIAAAQTVEELRAAWPFGEQGPVQVMVRRALDRGVRVA